MKSMDTLDCLSTFVGKIYHSFNNKEFFVAIFVDIRGAFDSVNISTLIFYLLSLNFPPKFYNILLSLSNKNGLVFSSFFGAYNTCSTFTDLPQGLSPILLNVYMIIIKEHLSRFGHKCLIYADKYYYFFLK